MVLEQVATKRSESKVRVNGVFFVFNIAWTELGWPCSYSDPEKGSCTCQNVYKVYLSRQELTKLAEEIPDVFPDGIPKANSDRIRRAIITRSLGRPLCPDHESSVDVGRID